jgi:hypothetical protein
MFTVAASRRTAENARKRAWVNDPCPEEPVPESSGGLRVAAEAARAVRHSRFELRDLYDAVRSVGRRVLVCPSDGVEADVAALCVMARDVCKKPVAVVTRDAAQRARVESKLAEMRFPLGACEFGSKAIVASSADVNGWESVGLRGVILISLGNDDQDAAYRSGLVRTVIAITSDRYAHPEAPTAYSPASLWEFTETSIAHRGQRQVVTTRLAGLWRRAGRDAWANDATARTERRDCPICMEKCEEQCVAACCTAALCRGCVEPWIRSNGTCPGCRGPADYTTMHLVVEPITLD